VTRDNSIVNAQTELSVARDAARAARAALDLGIEREALSRASSHDIPRSVPRRGRR
jgi:hypothetical protein